MRVVFLQDVSGIAKSGEIREVANGYGRNFLIPRKLALPARSETMNAIWSQLQTKSRVDTQIQAELTEIANQLNGREVFFEARVGDKDRLFGSITAADISAELESTAGLSVDKRKIDIGDPIRQVGSYEIAIRLAKDIVPIIKVTVNEKTT